MAKETEVIGFAAQEGLYVFLSLIQTAQIHLLFSQSIPHFYHVLQPSIAYLAYCVALNHIVDRITSSTFNPQISLKKNHVRVKTGRFDPLVHSHNFVTN